MITQPIKLNQDILRDFLADSLYSGTQLDQISPEQALEYLFHQYYIFLDTPPVVWWAEFAAEARIMMAIKGERAESSTYLLRSSRFVNFVQATLNHYPDPPSSLAPMPTLTR